MDGVELTTCLACNARVDRALADGDLCPSCYDRYHRTGRDWWNHA